MERPPVIPGYPGKVYSAEAAREKSQEFLKAQCLILAANLSKRETRLERRSAAHA
jgi:hypothetical protein